MGAPAGSDATEKSIYSTIQGKNSLNYGDSSYTWSHFQFKANPCACNTRTFDLHLQKWSWAHRFTWMFVVQYSDIFAVHPESGLATGGQSQGTVVAWQKNNQRSICCSHQVGAGSFCVLCRQEVTLPASEYVGWCVSFGVY